MIAVTGILIALFALLGTPLFIILAVLAILFFSSDGISTSVLAIEINKLGTAPILPSIPLFTFAGYVLSESRTPERLVNLSRAFLGWMPGGLAVVALVACAIFTAFTGASGVTIIALGGLLFPTMQKEGYPENFNLGLLTTSGSLGLLFPPSLPIIIFGYMAATSIDQLFMAGILPGMLLVLLLSFYSVFTGGRNKVPRYKFSWSGALKAAREAQWEIPLPIVILGGIYGGIFTVPEAAAITAAYVILVEVFIYRDIEPRGLFKIIRESMILVGGILIIMGSAMGLTNYLVDAEVPMQILDLIRQYITNKYAFLLLLNVFLLVVGCMMDIFSALMVVVPLIVPIAKAYDVNLVHLGIIFLANLEMGYATPPVGMNLFISSFRFGKPVLRLYWAALPFLGILLVALLIITYVPALSLFLVELFGVN